MDWPHAPLHRLGAAGAYFITGTTYLKQHHLRAAKRLDLHLELLFSFATAYELLVNAWTVFSNHYHCILTAEKDDAQIRQMLSDLHSASSREINAMDGTPGRVVWYQFWDKQLTFQKSYMARLNYVNQNPVHHGVVKDAETYRWCSAAWFRRTARKSFFESVRRFRTDALRINDDFEVEFE